VIDIGDDKLGCLFSSGKSVASILIAMMVDKGLLSYNDKISKHWPEFAQNGKDHILVSDLMRHDAGLS
jgi:CubicO group peptidase (beta-lactamase class C family)